MNTAFIPSKNLIPISEARRALGELVEKLKQEREFYLLKNGKIAAKLSLPDELIKEKRAKILKEVAGSWKNSRLDDDNFWRDILVKERHLRTKRKSLLL